MAEDTVDVTLGDLVTSLDRIERWVGDVKELLAQLDGRMIVASVPEAGETELLVQGQCPPPEEET